MERLYSMPTSPVMGFGWKDCINPPVLGSMLISFPRNDTVWRLIATPSCSSVSSLLLVHQSRPVPVNSSDFGLDIEDYLTGESLVCSSGLCNKQLLLRVNLSKESSMHIAFATRIIWFTGEKKMQPSELEPHANGLDFDRKAELKTFDETKAGVKGLVDSGITKIPRIFVKPPEKSKPSNKQFKFPIIDLKDIYSNPARRKEVVNRVGDASQSWGFFQVINHGISQDDLNEMLNGVRQFHEQETERKKVWYSRDRTKKFRYNCNIDLFTAPVAGWRDTFGSIMAPTPPTSQELPSACSDVLLKYSKQMMKLGHTLFELLSEALGLETNRLKDLDCAKGLSIVGHYYPACPQPELAIGTAKHADFGFLTILLQDHIGGLQVLYENQWVDVPPTPEALIVNIGDLLQLISNDNFKSSVHRVLANQVGPRVSLASFFAPQRDDASSKLYGPIKELVSEDNPPKYMETTFKGYLTYSDAKGLDGTSGLTRLRLDK